MDAYTKARELIDEAHSHDPTRTPTGGAAELLYGDRVEAWVVRLRPDASPILRLAARCQHLERWKTPRSSYPEGRVGYLKWRQGLYTQQADRARELLLQAGVSEAEADDAHTWISKSKLKTNPGTQALEDAAILVFLENEIEAFAAQHTDYPREKWIDILRKSWRKLSPEGQVAAKTLDLPPDIADLVGEAIS